jgi:phosphonate transport system ATP-binding protein
MIQVCNISKTLPNGKKLLDNISFTIDKGEFVGILGASGAGKTLTLRTLNGLLKPDSGSVFIHTKAGGKIDICTIKHRQLRKVRQKIGVIFQGYHLVQRLTVIENVMIGRLGSIDTFRSLFYGFTDDESKEAMLALVQVKMGHMADLKVANLSGGEKQRVGIARAIYQQPEILLADEPISNLDPSNARLIMKLIQPLSKEIPVVGVFHQPEMTAKFCTRIIAIKAGKIIYDGQPNLSNEQLNEIYGEELNSITHQEMTV